MFLTLNLDNLLRAALVSTVISLSLVHPQHTLGMVHSHSKRFEMVRHRSRERRIGMAHSKAYRGAILGKILDTGTLISSKRRQNENNLGAAKSTKFSLDRLGIGGTRKEEIFEAGPLRRLSKAKRDIVGQLDRLTIGRRMGNRRWNKKAPGLQSEDASVIIVL